MCTTNKSLCQPSSYMQIEEKKSFFPSFFFFCFSLSVFKFKMYPSETHCHGAKNLLVHACVPPQNYYYYYVFGCRFSKHVFRCCSSNIHKHFIIFITANLFYCYYCQNRFVNIYVYYSILHRCV